MFCRGVSAHSARLLCGITRANSITIKQFTQSSTLNEARRCTFRRLRQLFLPRAEIARVLLLAGRRRLRRRRRLGNFASELPRRNFLPGH
jgi:hypothetical protein